MAGNAEELGADIVRIAHRREPARTATQNCSRNRNRFDIVDRRRIAIKSHIGGKWRLETRLSLLAFETFEQRSLLAANIGTRAMMHIEVKRPTMHIVLADQFRGIGFINSLLKCNTLGNIFTPNINITGVRSHRE